LIGQLRVEISQRLMIYPPRLTHKSRVLNV
jgi:hypothetical protein